MTDLPLDVITFLGLLVLVLLQGGPLSGVSDTAPEVDDGVRRPDGPAPAPPVTGRD